MGSTLLFGQEDKLPGFTETKIESGSVFKKYEKGKLDSVIVTMAAVNYGNALMFSRTKDAIIIKNTNDEDSHGKIELKNKKPIKTFFFKNKPIITIEAIDLNLSDLPKNATISSTVENNLVSSYSSMSKFSEVRGQVNDKSLKLFYGLNIRSNLDNVDEIFNYIGDFFSKEDALLKLFYGNYAEQFIPQYLATLKTDATGKITDGIIFDFKNGKASEKNKYDIYKSGKIIISNSSTLKDFQKIFWEYLEKNWDFE